MSRISEPVLTACSCSCKIVICAALAILATLAAAQEPAPTIDPAVDEQAASGQESQQSQQQVDQQDDESGIDISENRQDTPAMNRTLIYHSHLAELGGDEYSQKAS